MNTPFHHRALQQLLAFVFTALVSLPLVGQTTTLLDFSQNVQAADGSNPNASTLGPYYSGSVIDYTNVGQLAGTFIDARITATAFGNGYTFAGHLTNYSQNVVGQPTGDAGIYYIANQPGEAGGLTWKMDFFEHGSNWLTPIVIPQARIMIYDVDGESFQSEAVRAFKSDGLISYQLGNTPQSLVASDAGSSILFQGPGINFSETDPTGASILLYQNTSSITLQFEAFTDITSPASNGVFSGIDGDLSLLQGNESGFNPPVEAPEPSSALLAILPIACTILTRRRRAASEARE
jgi:hypothetical protein